MNRRSLLGAPLLLLPAAAAANDYPQRPVRFIVPFAPGGTTDVLARALAHEMTARWNQPVVVENRAGGGAVIGTTVLAAAPGDGYTIGAIISSHAVNPGLRATLPYDSLADFTPITLLVRLPLTIAVHPAHPARSFAEFLDLARREPAPPPYGSSGTGTASHLMGELINLQAGTRMVHAPYRGGSAALQDLLGGHLPMSIHNTNIILPHMRSGAVRVLAVSTPARLPYLPDIPTVAETLPGFDVIEWYGLAGPKGVPPAVVTAIGQEVARAFGLPAFKTRFALEEGIELAAGTPEAFGRFLRAELERWPPLVRRLGITGE